MFFASITSALPMLNAKRVRPLAVTSRTRSGLMRDVPSLAELGQPEIDESAIYGVMAPAGIPPAVLRLLNEEIGKVLTSPQARQTLKILGADGEMYGGDPKMFADYLQRERQKWSKVVRESGAKVD